MSNTATHSSGSQDVISDSMTRIATTASKQKKLVAVGVVLILAATLAASLYLTKRNTFRAQAAEGLFKARQSLSEESKAYAESIKPVVAKSATTKKVESPPPNIEFAKFDVDTVMKKSVTEFEKVADGFPGTQAAYDAKMQLGSLYFDHGATPALLGKSAQWFEKASVTAPSNDQVIFALYNSAYAQEALGHCAESVKLFDRALSSGSGPIQGELLRGKARCQETLGDKTGAKATYENIIKALPNTDHSKFAESKKAAL